MSGLSVTRIYHFSAGHRLESAALAPEANAATFGPCHRPHGHNYLLEVTLAGQLDPLTGMSVDVAALDSVVARTVLDRVDHHDLSTTVRELQGVITTGEMLARTFWEWLEPALPAGRLRRVAVVETANNAFERRDERARPGEERWSG